MKAKYRRLWVIAAGLAACSAGLWLLLSRFADNVTFFYSPTEIVRLKQEQPAALTKVFRAGGLVEKGTIVRKGLVTQFVIHDEKERLSIRYEGLLPALFRENQGMIAVGSLQQDGVMQATELLTKHDENYMPPEVADALKKNEGYSILDEGVTP